MISKEKQNRKGKAVVILQGYKKNIKHTCQNLPIFPVPFQYNLAFCLDDPAGSLCCGKFGSTKHNTEERELCLLQGSFGGCITRKGTLKNEKAKILIKAESFKAGI